jgi:hypothetical protein
VKYSVSLPGCGTVTIDSRDMAMRQHLRVGERVTIGWRLDEQRVLADR